MSRARSIGASLVALGLGACVGPADGSELHRGRHLDLYEDPEATPICPGSLDDADHFLERTADYLGVPVRRYDYYYKAELPFRECGGRGACVTFGRVSSTRWVHHHELIHLLVPEQAPLLLEEGLADALTVTDYSADSVRSAMAEPFEAALDSATFRTSRDRESRLYRAGAVFVRYLLRTYGPERLLEWMRTTPAIGDASVAAAPFERVYGRRLADVLDDYRASDPDVLAALPQGLLWRGCDAPGVPLADVADPQRAEIPACRSSQTAHLDGVQLETVELDAPGLYALEVDDPDEVTMALVACPPPDCRPARVSGFFANGDPLGLRLFDADEGRVVVLGRRDPDGRGEADTRWRLARLGDPDPAGCEDAASIRPASGTRLLRYEARPATHWQALELAAGPTLRTRIRLTLADDRDVSIRSALGLQRAVVCVGGCDPTTCRGAQLGDDGLDLAVLEAGVESELLLFAAPGLPELTLTFVLRDAE